jgi:hypothetical protein
MPTYVYIYDAVMPIILCCPLLSFVVLSFFLACVVSLFHCFFLSFFSFFLSFSLSLPTHAHKSTAKRGTFPYAKRDPLAVHVMIFSPDVVRFLVVNGANIQAKDEDGMPLGNITVQI